MSASPGAPAPLIGATDYLRQALQLLDGRPALANDDAGVTVTWVDIAGVRASVAAALTLLERQPAVSRGVPTPAMIEAAQRVIAACAHTHTEDGEFDSYVCNACVAAGLRAALTAPEP